MKILSCGYHFWGSRNNIRINCDVFQARELTHISCVIKGITNIKGNAHVQGINPQPLNYRAYISNWISWKSLNFKSWKFVNMLRSGHQSFLSTHAFDLTRDRTSFFLIISYYYLDYIFLSKKYTHAILNHDPLNFTLLNNTWI